jgi:hypothetical protein
MQQPRNSLSTVRVRVDLIFNLCSLLHLNLGDDFDLISQEWDFSISQGVNTETLFHTLKPLDSSADIEIST